MPYRTDPDLEFLSECDNEDLAVLLEILRGPAHSPRTGQGLTSHKAYKQFHPLHERYWREIAEEIQRCGGHSLLTAARGWQGVLYANVLGDVCSKVGVSGTNELSVSQIEFRLLSTLLARSLDKMTEDQRASLMRELGIKSLNLTGPAVAAAIQAVIVAGGFLSYQIAVIVANAVATAVIGQGLRFGANTALMRAMGIAAGPIGWALTGIWTAIEIGGPAYRITIPACVHVAYMRAKTIQTVQAG